MEAQTISDRPALRAIQHKDLQGNPISKLSPSVASWGITSMLIMTQLIPTDQILHEVGGNDLWTQFEGSKQPLTAATTANQFIDLIQSQLLVGIGGVATMEVSSIVAPHHV